MVNWKSKNVWEVRWMWYKVMRNQFKGTTSISDLSCNSSMLYHSVTRFRSPFFSKRRIYFFNWMLMKIGMQYFRLPSMMKCFESAYQLFFRSSVNIDLGLNSPNLTVRCIINCD